MIFAEVSSGGCCGSASRTWRFAIIPLAAPLLSGRVREAVGLPGEVMIGNHGSSDGREHRADRRSRSDPDLVANWGLSTLDRLLGHLCVRMSWVWLSASTCGTARAPRTLTRTQSGRQVSAGPPNCCRPTVDVQFCTSTLHGNRSEKGVKVEP